MISSLNSSDRYIYVSQNRKEEAIGVSYKPSFTKRMTDVEAMPGDTVRFLIRAIGEPPPKITW